MRFTLYRDTMHDRSTLRVHTHQTEFEFFATVTVIESGQLQRLTRSPSYLDAKGLEGWVKDFKRNLKHAMCLWCGEPANFITEIDGLEIFGFCSVEDETSALAAASEEARFEL